MTSIGLALLLSCSFELVRLAVADECGTRFTDFASSAHLAQIVLKGKIKEFNPPAAHSQARSANVTVQKVYKGMEVLKEYNRSVVEGDDILVHHFGVQDTNNCIAPDSEDSKGQDKVFFLRQTSHRGMLRLSAMPVAAESSVDRRVRRSLCDTCLKPPEIKRLVCQECAKEPTIKTMRSKRAKIGRRGRIRCVARGKPAPTITWAKGDIPIVSGTEGITIKTSGLTSVLIFQRVTIAHSGRYKCIANNEIGQTEAVINLDVTLARSRPTYTIESAPDKVPCQTNPCLNGGSCVYSPSLDLRRCICSYEFEGVQCENSKSFPSVQGNNFDQVPVVTERNKSTIASTDNNGIGNRPVSTTIMNENSKSSETTSTTTHATILTTPFNTTKEHESLPTTSTHRPVSSSSRPFVQPKRTVISQPTGQFDPRYPVSKKSFLKQIPCREKNYCLNRGKCRFIRKLNKKFCKCRSGYSGPRCENKL